jgi:hypothetical protein
MQMMPFVRETVNNLKRQQQRDLLLAALVQVVFLILVEKDWPFAALKVNNYGRGEPSNISLIRNKSRADWPLC